MLAGPGPGPGPPGNRPRAAGTARHADDVEGGPASSAGERGRGARTGRWSCPVCRRERRSVLPTTGTRGKTAAAGRHQHSVSVPPRASMSGSAAAVVGHRVTRPGGHMATIDTAHRSIVDDPPRRARSPTVGRDPARTGVRRAAHRVRRRADRLRSRQVRQLPRPVGPVPRSRRSPRPLPVTPHQAMYAVGVVEVVAGPRGASTPASVLSSSPLGWAGSSSTCCSSPATTTWRCATSGCCWRPSRCSGWPPASTRGRSCGHSGRPEPDDDHTPRRATRDERGPGGVDGSSRRGGRRTGPPRPLARAGRRPRAEPARGDRWGPPPAAGAGRRPGRRVAGEDTRTDGRRPGRARHPAPVPPHDVPERRRVRRARDRPRHPGARRSASTTCCRSPASPTSATCRATGSSGCRSSRGSSSCSRAARRCRSG